MAEKEHSRLLYLALDAVAVYVSDLCLQLLKLLKNREKDKLCDALQICRALQDMLHSMIPHSLANYATAKLLKCIDNQSSNIHQWSKEPWREEILQELISAIIHPSVTVIELSKEPQHIFPFGFKWNFLVPLVYSRLHTLNKLKVLRLGRPRCESWTVDCVNVTRNLEEFTFINMCNDRMLSDLAKSCQTLKRLDVNESRKVTDASVNTLLKLGQLEELNLVGTSISEVGLTRLLTGFTEDKPEDSYTSGSSKPITELIGNGFIIKSITNLSEHLNGIPKDFSEIDNDYFISNKFNKLSKELPTYEEIYNLKQTNDLSTDVSMSIYDFKFQNQIKNLNNNNIQKRSQRLKSFGCSYVTLSQVGLLATRFPNLVELRLSHCGVCDLTQLKGLKQLQKLSLRSVKFGQMHELLSALGKQLVYLDLWHVQNIDIRFIGLSCLSLRCFHLFSYGVLQPSLEHYNRELLPGFQSVVCLQFDCDWSREWTDYMLSQCTNVKKVDITSHRRDTYLLLKQVLLRNPLRYLEKLCWSPSSPEGECIAKQLADQCPNLTEVRGLCKSKVNYRGVQLL